MKKFVLKLYELLTTVGIRFLFKKLGIAVGGFWGWIISEIIVTILDKIAKPQFLRAVRGIKFLRNVFKGTKHAEALDEATTPDEYLDTLNGRK